MANDREVPLIPPPAPAKPPPSPHDENPYNLIPLKFPDKPTRLSTSAHASLLLLLLHRLRHLEANDTKHLPKPKSQAAIHAARYREGEVRIITSACGQLTTYLLSLQTSGYIMRYDTILTTPMIPGLKGTKLLSRFRAGIKSQFQTLDMKKMDPRMKDVIGLIWLSTIWIAYDSNSYDSGSSPTWTPLPQKLDSREKDKHYSIYTTKICNWLEFVHKTYCPPIGWEGSTHDPENCAKLACFKTWEKESSQPKMPDIMDFMNGMLSGIGGGGGEAGAMVASMFAPQSATPGGGGRGGGRGGGGGDMAEYIKRMDSLEAVLELIHNIASLYPYSVFADKRWSKEFLWWASEVWKAEILGVPTRIFDGRSGDAEMVLFLEGVVGNIENEEVG